MECSAAPVRGVPDAEEEAETLGRCACPRRGESHRAQREADEADPEAPDRLRWSQPHLGAGKRRIDPYRMTASEPDGDSHAAAGRAVRLMAGDADVRVASQAQAERQSTQQHSEASHHKNLRSKADAKSAGSHCREGAFTGRKRWPSSLCRVTLGACDGVGSGDVFALR